MLLRRGTVRPTAGIFAAGIVAFTLGIFAGASNAAAQPCTVTLKADGNTAAVQRAMEKAGKRTPVVCLKPGIYKGARLLATRSVVVKRVGKGKVVFDAGERGRVFTVIDKDVDATLKGITLTNGIADEGGAVAVLRDSKLTLEDCWITDNRATGKGGAVHVGAGLAVLIRTRINRNDAPRAGAVHVGTGARLVLAHSIITDNRNQGGANAPIYLTPGANVEIHNSTIAYNHAHGVFMRPAVDGKRSSLLIESSVIMGGSHSVHVPRREAQMVEVYRSVLHGKTGFIPLDLQSSRKLPVFNLTDVERYRPAMGSPAIGLGRCRRFGRKDVAGKPRAMPTCTAGALEALPKDVKKTIAERKRVRKVKAKERKADEAFNW